MMKRILFVLTLVLAFSATANSQWVLTPFNKPIDTLKANSGGHGIIVDPDNKIWVGEYKPLKADSLPDPTDPTKYIKNIAHIDVFQADGTPVSFSPIRSLTINGVVTPLTYSHGTVVRGLTGLNRDKDGNIIVSIDYSLYKINYKTGEGMARYDYTGNNGITRAACDTVGDVFISATLADLPLVKLDQDLANPEVIVEKVPYIGRNLEVSPDGNTVYATRFTGSTCIIYSRPNEFASYTRTDSIFNGWKVEGITINPVNHLIYASAGSYADVPFGAYSPLQPDRFVTIGTYYGVRPNDYKVVDSIKWKYAEPFLGKDAAEKNRGIAFSNDGKTAYLVEFNTSTVPLLQRYVTQTLPSDVKKENSAVVENYSLSQNYPNPFNPSTEIKFSVAKDGFVSLKVFDILGKEVATLANGQMTKGNYSVKVDGKNLTSGIYIYQLNANGVMLSRKMTLMK